MWHVDRSLSLFLVDLLKSLKIYLNLFEFDRWCFICFQQNGVCNQYGRCHCNDGYDPVSNCLEEGAGGSIDSGPAAIYFSPTPATTTTTPSDIPKENNWLTRKCFLFKLLTYMPRSSSCSERMNPLLGLGVRLKNLKMRGCWRSSSPSSALTIDCWLPKRCFDLPATDNMNPLSSSQQRRKICAVIAA